MSTRDSRRRSRNRANEIGLLVRGLNGEVRRGLVVGGGGPISEHNATVYVADDFAPITFPIAWSHVRAIAEGWAPAAISYTPNTHIMERLSD